MAILFMEGFDGVLSQTQLVKKWGNEVAGGQVLQANGRNGGGNILLTFFDEIETPIQTTSSTVIIGAAVNPLAPRNSDADLLLVDSQDNSPQFRARLLASDSKLVISRGNGLATLGTSSVGLLSGAYTYVELKVFVHQTLGTVDLRFDGVDVLNLTNVNTRGSFFADTSVAVLRIRGENGTGIRMDDLYIADDTGTKNNDFLGDVRVDTLVPTSDDTTEFDTSTPSANHFENVDEAAGVDEDTSYIETPTNGDRDIFGMSNLPVHPVAAAVLAIQPWCYGKKITGSGDLSVRHLVEPVATIYNQPARGPSAEDWRVIQSDILEDNPETATDWQESEVDAMKIGVEVI